MKNKGALTRQNIIEKSLQLFSIKGYYNTSVNDILNATGLTKGGLYGHFKSKEDIWYAVYEEAVAIWRPLVLNGLRDIKDPIERIIQVIKNDMKDYLGSDVFEGGCFFLNMLVELSGQNDSMSKQILTGYVQFSRMLKGWLQEADRMEMLKSGLNYKDITSFIIISLNGASALYTSSKDPAIWLQTMNQLTFYIEQLRR